MAQRYAQRGLSRLGQRLGLSTRTAQRLDILQPTFSTPSVPGLGPVLTTLNPLGVSSSTRIGSQTLQGKCDCPAPAKKKPSSERCTNPVVKRSRKGDLLTITRRLTCPQSK